MQRTRRMALALVAVFATSGLLAGTASSASKPKPKPPKDLEITRSGGKPLSSSEEVTAVWEFTVGTEPCRNEMTGHITVNDAKTDVFTGTSGIFKCGVVENGATAGAVDFSFGVTGKGAAGSVSFAIGKCTYSGTKFKGTNSTTGPLTIKVSGTLKTNKGCSVKSATLQTKSVELIGPEEKFLYA